MKIIYFCTGKKVKMFKPPKPSPTENFIYGFHAIKSVLLHQPHRAKKLFIARKDSDEIRALARENSVQVELVERSFLDKAFGTGSEAQGLVLKCAPFLYLSLEELLERDPKRLLLLDSWQDSANIGRAARACLCFGADGIVILKDRSGQVNSAAEKSAVGALAIVPVARVVNLSAALSKLKQLDFFVYGAEEHGQVVLEQCDFAAKAAIVVGQEGEGLRELTKKQCDLLVSIPMQAQDICLNAADTALLFLYELSKK